MGEKIQKAFDLIFQEEGLQARMLVAMNAGIPSSKAAATPDTEMNIKKMEAAIKEITGKTVTL